MIEEPPTVNDLANLLAQAMRRPLVELAHRPQTLYLRSRPQWAELLPHLKEVGIQVVSQETLPKWDAAFGDLYAQVERARSARGAKRTRGRSSAKASATGRRGKPMARTKKAAATSQRPAEQGNVRLYTLEVFLLSGPITEKFAKKNPVVSRTIQMRGDQTLATASALQGQYNQGVTAMGPCQ